MSNQAAFDFAAPDEDDPEHRQAARAAVRAIVAGGRELRIDNYCRDVVVRAGAVLVALRAVPGVVQAARYMGHEQAVAQALDAWAERADAAAAERYRQHHGEHATPDWRPAELLPEDYWAG